MVEEDDGDLHGDGEFPSEVLVTNLRVEGEHHEVEIEVMTQDMVNNSPDLSSSNAFSHNFHSEGRNQTDRWQRHSYNTGHQMNSNITAISGAVTPGYGRSKAEDITSTLHPWRVQHGDGSLHQSCYQPRAHIPYVYWAQLRPPTPKVMP